MLYALAIALLQIANILPTASVSPASTDTNQVICCDGGTSGWGGDIASTPK